MAMNLLAQHKQHMECEANLRQPKQDESMDAESGAEVLWDAGPAATPKRTRRQDTRAANIIDNIMEKSNATASDRAESPCG